ncbi:unnamed protein product [Enterobius vermicularis]|uniref:Uncharacterized protein n=1 Tax=Enterobius vermicularis TaxID=51028 RepID=A0A0N4VC01_ENTVE|nr:unnamed protein product [Enterobius vermicularis]
MKTQNNTDGRNQRLQSNSPGMLDLAVHIAESSPSPVDERSIQRMFECDPSQLPAEQPQWSRNSSLDNSPPRTNNEPDDKYKQNPGPKASVEEYKATGTETANTEEKNQPQKSERITGEQEEIHNNKYKPTEDFQSKMLTEPRVIRSKTAHEIGNWSSESEDEQNDVYYRLSEADDDESRQTDNPKVTKNSDDEEDIEKIEPDSSFETSHLYQRLEESPTPSPNNPESTTLV